MPEDSTTSHTWTRLRLQQDDAVATVTLDRPEVLHALDARMFDELERVFEQLEAAPEVRVVLLTGSGDRAFAAGADIRGLLETDEVSGCALSERGQAVFNRIESCSKPVIACVNGVALGGGCELALACTMRFASDRAKLGLPELKLGLIPGYGGTQRLPRLIGRSAALRLLLSGEAVNASEALRLGLVDGVVPAAELMPYAERLAKTITSLAPLAISGVIQAVRSSYELPMKDGLRVESAIFGRLCATADKTEGVTAFLEKRQPRWTAK